MGTGRLTQQLTNNGFLMKYFFIAGLFFLAFSQAGCYYDKGEILNPATSCDTTTVTYSGNVNPILTANCTGCHSGNNAPNGVKLDTYANVKLLAQDPSGILLGVITHSPNFDPMPKNGNKLSDCSIAKISIWVHGGAPNN
jgi:hypothetical protein